MKLTDLQRLNEKRVHALTQTGIETVEQLLDFFPRRYLDKTNVVSSSELIRHQEEAVTVIGTLTDVRETGTGRKKRLEATLQDRTGQVKGVWFKGLPYFKKNLRKGETYSFFGKPRRFGRWISMAHPEVDRIKSTDQRSNSIGIFPIYPGNSYLSGAYVTSSLLQSWMRQILEHLTITEFLPDNLLDVMNLPRRNDAYRMIHFPENEQEPERALQRFKFEELLLFELGVMTLKTRKLDTRPGPRFPHTDSHTREFFQNTLPFELTEGQRSALSDIKRDVQSGRQMNRLIQGDVGSGKTVVALGAVLMAIDNGYQAVFLAPTEVLAEQHYRTIQRLLGPLGLNIRLLTGHQGAALRRDVLSDLAGGTTHLVIGTHALLEDEVRFHRLGLAVIDEQHRFGVSQRAHLRDKGDSPHILVMSATPIPRSLAMTLYSDLDISLIRDKPAGRKPVITAQRGEIRREQVYQFIEEQLQEGAQAYVIYPLVEESESLDLQNATLGFENIRERFPNHASGLLHGRMASEEKDRVMRDFSEGRIRILVATTVIEVGVDVPNASIMVIEHAERFGLAQLHQLRGRIGRGERQSYCILMSEPPPEQTTAIRRLKTMTETDDGFRIAEADLKIRGPGDFMGTRQSGLPDFQHADILEDQALLEEAKRHASQLLEEDPQLSAPKHRALRERFTPYFEEKARYFQIS